MAKKIFVDTIQLANETTARTTADTNLSNQISILSNDRGYLTTKNYEEIDLDTLVYNGVFGVAKPTANAPAPQIGETYFIVTVVTYTSAYVTQQARAFFQNITFERTKKGGGGWSSWKQIATTDKIDILLTPATGCTISNNNSYMVNNVAYINFRLTKDTGTFSGSNTHIATLPFNTGVLVNVFSVVAFAGGGYYNAYGNSYSNTIELKLFSDGLNKVTRVDVSGVILL